MTTTIAIASVANLATFLRSDLAGQEVAGCRFVTPETATAGLFTVEGLTPMRMGEMVGFAIECINGKLSAVQQSEFQAIAIRHNMAAWAIAILDVLHELALVEDWKRALEADVDVKVWPEYTDDIGEEWDWKARVSSVMGSAEYTAIGTTPGHAMKAALELAAGGMPVSVRRVSVYFSDAKWAPRHAFRLATDDLDQAVKEHIATLYVKDRDARFAAAGPELLDDTLPYVAPRGDGRAD